MQVVSHNKLNMAHYRCSLFTKCTKACKKKKVLQNNTHPYFSECYRGFESDDVSNIKSALYLSALKPVHMDPPPDYP